MRLLKKSRGFNLISHRIVFLLPFTFLFNFYYLLQKDMYRDSTAQASNPHSTASHCAFSSNLFHGHIVQKHIDQMSPPENKKCSPGKVFGIKPPSNPWTFEQQRPQRPVCEAVSTLHQPKNDMLQFFKFLQKKVSRLDKKVFNIFVQLWGL